MSVEKGREVVHTTTHAKGSAREMVAEIFSVPAGIETRADAAPKHKFTGHPHVHGKDIEGKPVPVGSVFDHYDKDGHAIVKDPTNHLHKCNDKDLDWDNAQHS